MKIFNKKFLGLVISILLIFLLAQQIDLKKSLESIHHINLTYLPLIIPIYFISFIFRAYKWRVILSDNSDLKIRSLISSLFIGFMVNNLLPARMGEIYRAHLFGKKENINRATVFASIVLERIIDGCILFLMLLAFVCSLYPRPWLIKLSFAVGFIFVGAFIFLLLFAKFKNSISPAKYPILINIANLFNRAINLFPISIQKSFHYLLERLLHLLTSFIEGLSIFYSPSRLVKSFFFTLMVWIIEGTVTFIIIRSFGISINYLSVFFVLSVTAFSTMIPSGPASIGPFQLGYVLSLGIFKVPKETAFAASIVNQFICIVFIMLVGLYFMWKDHINMTEIQKDSDSGLSLCE